MTGVFSCRARRRGQEVKEPLNQNFAFITFPKKSSSHWRYSDLDSEPNMEAEHHRLVSYEVTNRTLNRNQITPRENI